MMSMKWMKDAILLIIFWVLIVVNACVLYVLVMLPTFTLLFVHSRRVIIWRRSYLQMCFSVFSDIVAALVCDVCGVVVNVYPAEGTSWELLQADGNVVVVSNNVPAAAGIAGGISGWIFAACCYGSALGRSGDVRMILNDRLRGVPVFGWGLQVLLFVFVNRERRRDENIATIQRVFSFLLQTGQGRSSMLVFPLVRVGKGSINRSGERDSTSPHNGDQLSNNTQASALSPQLSSTSLSSLSRFSTEAVKEGLSVRPAGFIACVKQLRNVASIGLGDSNAKQRPRVPSAGPAAVHDICVSVDDNVSPSSPQARGGILPSVVNLAIARYPLDDLPVSDADLGSWLEERCAAKSHSGQVVTENNKSRMDVMMLYATFAVVGSIIVTALMLLPWTRVVLTTLIIGSVAARAVGGIDIVDLALHGDMMVGAYAVPPKRNASSSSLSGLVSSAVKEKST